jgi:hypothetical protein
MARDKNTNIIIHDITSLSRTPLATSEINTYTPQTPSEDRQYDACQTTTSSRRSFGNDIRPFDFEFGTTHTPRNE